MNVNYTVFKIKFRLNYVEEGNIYRVHYQQNFFVVIIFHGIILK